LPQGSDSAAAVNIEGATVTFKCNTGYTIDSTSKKIQSCSAGSWSGGWDGSVNGGTNSAPTCQIPAIDEYTQVPGSMIITGTPNINFAQHGMKTDQECAALARAANANEFSNSISPYYCRVSKSSDGKMWYSGNLQVVSGIADMGQNANNLMAKRSIEPKSFWRKTNGTEENTYTGGGGVEPQCRAFPKNVTGYYSEYDTECQRGTKTSSASTDDSSGAAHCGSGDGTGSGGVDGHSTKCKWYAKNSYTYIIKSITEASNLSNGTGKWCGQGCVGSNHKIAAALQPWEQMTEADHNTWLYKEMAEDKISCGGYGDANVMVCDKIKKKHADRYTIHKSSLKTTANTTWNIHSEKSDRWADDRGGALMFSAKPVDQEHKSAKQSFPRKWKNKNVYSGFSEKYTGKSADVGATQGKGWLSTLDPPGHLGDDIWDVDFNLVALTAGQVGQLPSMQGGDYAPPGTTFENWLKDPSLPNRWLGFIKSTVTSAQCRVHKGAVGNPNYGKVECFPHWQAHGHGVDGPGYMIERIPQSVDSQGSGIPADPSISI